MLCNSTRSIDEWLGITGESRESGGTLDPILHVVLLSLGVIILSGRNFNWSAVIKENVWVVVLLTYMLVSVSWSDMPFIASKRWIRELTALVMAFVVVSEPDPRQAIESFFRRVIYVVIPFSVLLIKYYQNWGVEYSPWTGEIQWIGVSVQKNGLGRLCLISAFVLVWTLIRRWQKRDLGVSNYHTVAEVTLLIMTLWLLKGPSMWAASATAVCALGAGFLTLFVLSWMQRHRLQLSSNAWVLVLAGIVCFGTVTPFVGGSTVTALTSTVGRDATLTGRTDIWSSLLPDVQGQPFLGHGFGSFWTSARIREHRVGEAHNGYLEVWLGLGFVGLVLTAIFLLSSIGKSATLLNRDYDWAALCICFLVMVAVHNISESSFESLTRSVMAAVLFLSVSISAATKFRPADCRGHAPTGRLVAGMQFVAERQNR